MLASAAEVLRERGAAGVTIDEVLTRSGAPRGSVYHHFPGGRGQILTEALQRAGAAITANIDRDADRGSRVLLSRFVEVWEQLLHDSDFTAGCPVVAAAIGSSEEDSALSQEAGQIFGTWRTALAAAFAADGFDAADAMSLAVTTIAALEGAVVLCRSMRSTTPLHDVAAQLEFLVRSRDFVHRFGLPVRS